VPRTRRHTRASQAGLPPRAATYPGCLLDAHRYSVRVIRPELLGVLAWERTAAPALPGRHLPHQHCSAEPCSPGMGSGWPTYARAGYAGGTTGWVMPTPASAEDRLVEYELSRRRRPGRAAAKVKARDEPSAAVPPGRPPIGLPARPLGNPAADPLVTHLSSVALQLGCCLPGQADRHVPHRHQPAVPTHPCPEAARPSCADRSSPAAWAAVSQCGRDVRHPLPPRQGRHPPQRVSETGSSVTRTRPAMQPTTDRDRPRDRQIQRAQGAMRFRLCGVLLAAYWMLGSAPGGFADPLDDRYSPHRGPRRRQGQAGDPWPTGWPCP
jgi:hypothetical protein